jgi:PGF-CTERM protein
VGSDTSTQQVHVEEADISIHNCYLDGRTLYLTTGTDPHDAFTAYDISGDSATELSAWQATSVSDAWANAYQRSGPGAHDVWVQDDYAYAACWDAGTFVVDVSDPSNPEYVTNIGGFDPDEIAGWSRAKRSRQGFRPPGNAHYVQPDESGDLLAIGGESWQHEGAGGAMGIDLWDVSDLQNPTKLSTIEPPASPDQTREGTFTTSHNFDIRGDVLYSSWYFGGVKRHDISDPENPAELTAWRRPKAASIWTAQVHDPGSTFVASDYGTAQNGEAGLWVFPDEDGTSLQPFPGQEGTATDTATATTATDTATATTATDTETGTDATDTETDVQTEPATDTETSSPGFGPVAGLSALGLSAWLARRRRDDE